MAEQVFDRKTRRQLLERCDEVGALHQEKLRANGDLDTIVWLGAGLRFRGPNVHILSTTTSRLEDVRDSYGRLHAEMELGTELCDLDCEFCYPVEES